MPKDILSENVFESVVLLVLAMSFMVLRFSASDSANASFFVWLVMIVKTCVLVSLVCSILFLLVCNDNSGSDEERRPLLPFGTQRGNVPVDAAA